MARKLIGVLTTPQPPIFRIGVTGVIVSYVQIMTNFVLQGSVTIAQLGAEFMMNSLSGLLTSTERSLSHTALVPTAANTGRFFGAYVTLTLGDGMDSWGYAYELLDPNGYSMAAGQEAAARYIRAAFEIMIQNNLQEGFFVLARQALPRQTGPQAVILGLWITITSR